MRPGHALQAMLLAFALIAVAFAAWRVWDCADPVLELQRDPPAIPPLMFKKPMPPGPWKGKIPGQIPKKATFPEANPTPQIETRPQLISRLPIATESCISLGTLSDVIATARR